MTFAPLSSAPGRSSSYLSAATGNITASLVRGPDGLTTFTLDPTSTSPYPCYHLFSPHGDTTMITDAQGGSIAATRYDAFGNTIGGVTGLWYGYTGKYERYSDGATGTTQMGVREYDPGLGRFISADPLKGDVSDPLQRNRYPYVGNDPMTRYDLNGLWWDEVWGKAKDFGSWLNDRANNKPYPQQQKELNEKYSLQVQGEKDMNFRSSRACEQSSNMSGFRDFTGMLNYNRPLNNDDFWEIMVNGTTYYLGRSVEAAGAAFDIFDAGEQSGKSFRAGFRRSFIEPPARGCTYCHYWANHSDEMVFPSR